MISQNHWVKVKSSAGSQKTAKFVVRRRNLAKQYGGWTPVTFADQTTKRPPPPQLLNAHLEPAPKLMYLFCEANKKTNFTNLSIAF
jgi:hypothetical protein